MAKAYSPRNTTVDLIAQILKVPGVKVARSYRPNAQRGTFIRVTLNDFGGTYTDFTLAEAREWLASTASR